MYSFKLKTHINKYIYKYKWYDDSNEKYKKDMYLKYNE